jgi:hypothetical protein
MLTNGWPVADSKPTGDARWLDFARVSKGFTLRARISHEESEVRRPDTKYAVAQGAEWIVISFEYDEATLAAVVCSARIRVVLFEPHFSERWELVGT